MPNRFTAVLDANVLYGGLHRHIALSLAEADLYRPAWSSEILDEFERNLATRIDPKKAKRQLQLIRLSFPDSEVVVRSALVKQIDLTDVDDRHVVAAAIQTQAALIVTDNLKHFPNKSLEAYDVVAVSADKFFSDCITVSELTAVKQIKKMRQ
ncbi:MULTISPECIES: PIN domain-containing protein [Rhodobacterales]